MGSLPESEDVDFFVEGGDSDPDSVRETVEFVKEYKRRPQHAAEVLEAKRILDSLKINSKDHGMEDPAALLEFWRRTVADLSRDGDGPSTNGDGS